jgi:hypothetical protein
MPHIKRNTYFCCPNCKLSMLQRIQTVYLFIAFLLSGVLIFFVSLWSNEAGQPVYVEEVLLALALFLASAVLSLVTIFLFKNRKLQFVLGRVNILLNFILLGVFVYWSLTLPGEMDISEKGIGMFVPVLSIVFLVLANKAIKKDEDLVKSADRFR